jgi:hypothetical protein
MSRRSRRVSQSSIVRIRERGVDATPRGLGRAIVVVILRTDYLVVIIGAPGPTAATSVVRRPTRGG